MYDDDRVREENEKAELRSSDLIAGINKNVIAMSNTGIFESLGLLQTTLQFTEALLWLNKQNESQGRVGYNRKDNKDGIPKSKLTANYTSSRHVDDTDKRPETANIKKIFLDETFYPSA